MKIACLLSGGVDSSVALRLLKNQYYDVTAFYLKIWLQDEYSFLGDCPWEEDLSFANEVCKQANVKLEVLPLQNEYWDSVVTYTITEIKEGRTPNPDIFCNSLIKFGQFYEKIDNSFEKVATGHYAQLEESNGIFKLKCSPDKIKDQTYFLAYLKQHQLKRAMFPIGSYTKKEVRSLAMKYELPNKKRKDSQGICFLGQIKFKDFLKFHLGTLTGDIVDIDTQKILGKHDGYYFYTIGQRSGLGLGGGPWYVVRKDIQNNIIFVSKGNDNEKKYRTEFSVTNFNWIGDSPQNNSELKVKIRHGERTMNCKLEIKNEIGFVTLTEPEAGIAPGQFAVFYDNDYCLGASVICEE